LAAAFIGEIAKAFGEHDIVIDDYFDEGFPIIYRYQLFMLYIKQLPF